MAIMLTIRFDGEVGAKPGWIDVQGLVMAEIGFVGAGEAGDVCFGEGHFVGEFAGAGEGLDDARRRGGMRTTTPRLRR